MKKIIYIETPKGSFVKRNEQQRIDFVSPLPCPFNYGHIKGEVGGDGAVDRGVDDAQAHPLVCRDGDEGIRRAVREAHTSDLTKR